MLYQAKQVLIVDDEPNVRLNFRTALETEHYDVFEATSAGQALELMAEHSFVFAIVDLRMPGMDGLELLAKMRENGIKVPVVMVTAYGDVPDAVKAMKLGAIDFLQKPLRPNDLRDIADEVTKRDARPEDPTETFNAHLVAAERCLNLGAFRKARLHLVKALELNPESVEAFNLARALAEINEVGANSCSTVNVFKLSRTGWSGQPSPPAKRQASGSGED